MRKYFSLLIIGLVLSGCATTSQTYTSQTYHEIETTLTSEIVDDIVDFSSVIPKEISQLQESGEIFWQDQNNKIQGRTQMDDLESKIECKNGEKEDCSKQTAESYGFGKDIYTIGSMNGNDNYSILKNDKEIFSHKMYFGAESVIEDASVVLNSPAFTFYDLKEWKDENTPVVNLNIWYNNETINEKYSVEASSHLFSYKDKIGFVGEKDGKKSLFFNGQKISQDFDEIRTNSCCAIFAYPIELDKNGILFFLAKRGEKYFFVEIDLNKYLK